MGKGKAPFKKTTKGKPPPVMVDSKALVEDVPGSHLVNPASGQKTNVAARLYNFHKAMSPFDRGDRMDDSSSLVYVGETLRFGMSEYLYEPAKKAFPAGISMIPQGSIVEIVVTPCSSGDNLEKGYGLKLTHVHLHQSSLQSYNVSDSLGYFPSTFDDGRAFAAKCLEVGAPIRMNVDSGSLTVFAAASPSSFVMDVGGDTPFLRFSSEDGDIIPGIREADVHPDVLMQCLNCPGDLVLARTLADVACAVGAMKLLVYESKYFNRVHPGLSTYRCYPVVDAAILFKGVDIDEIPEDETSAVFPLEVSLPSTGPIGIRVSLAAVSSAGEDKVGVPCVDLPIASSACSFKTGFRFDVVILEDGCSIMDMYFLAFAARRKGGPAAVGRTVYERKRTFDEIGD